VSKLRPSLALFGTFLLSVSAVGCSSDTPPSTSYLLVQLGPASNAVPKPRNALVLIEPEGMPSLPMCLNIEGTAGTVTASFVLSREPDRDASLPVKLTVTPYDAVAGSGEPGKDFACPPTMPPVVGPGQSITVAFCNAATRQLRFEVGAQCGCAGAGGSGGAGAAGGSGGTGDAGGAGATGGMGAAGAGGGTAGAGGTSGFRDSSCAGTGGAGAGGSGACGGTGGAGASCGCGTDAVCGVGVSPSGSRCGFDECCKGTIVDACAELETPH